MGKVLDLLLHPDYVAGGLPLFMVELTDFLLIYLVYLLKVLHSFLDNIQDVLGP